MNILQQFSKNIFQPKETIQERNKKRYDLLIQASTMLTRAKVDGLLSLEVDVYDYEKETQLIQKIFKKAVNMILYGAQSQQIKWLLEFEKLLLFISKKPKIYDLEDLYLLETILQAFINGDTTDEFFRNIRHQLQKINGSFESRMISEIIFELEEKMISEKKKEWNYPILSHLDIQALQKQAEVLFILLQSLWDESIQYILRETFLDDMLNFLWVLSQEQREYILNLCSQRTKKLLSHDLDMRFYMIPQIWYPKSEDEKETSSIGYEDIVKSIENIKKSLIKKEE